MIPTINNRIRLAVLLLSSLAISFTLEARPDVQKNGAGTNEKRRGQLKTTASCKPAEASIDLDINNVRARLMTGGDMWWDNGTSEARYEIPKGSRKNSLFAGSIWIGGRDDQQQLKVAAQTYRQTGNDYWPGPLDPTTAEITESECSEWDRFWKINRETITRFRELPDPGSADGDSDFEAIFQWPAVGNDGNAVGRTGAPLNMYTGIEYAPFVDFDNNGLYDPTAGDYPDIFGDQFIWWVFNDKGNVKQQSNTDGIGIEVQASAFAYSTKDFLNDATFYNYKLINRGNLSLDSTYISTWTDADLGYYRDDYIGCDTSRGLGILYNGRSIDGDGQVNSYGDRVPMVGVDFFKGPIKYDTSGGVIDTVVLGMTAFTYYNNDFTVIGNPSNGVEIYNYMTGSIRNGQRFSNDFKGPNTPSKAYGEGPLTSFVFPGDPANKDEWSECTCNNPVSDRRFIHSSGAFRLEPGVVNDITIGAVWVSDVGGCPNTSFSKIRIADDLAQGLFDNNFQTIEGPEAPRMVVRELDRKLVFYLLNDEISTNYQERYGYDTADKYTVSSPKAANLSNDSLYKFEGYRVFQLKDRFVTPAEIFDETGKLNENVAAEVFQCDIRNGITRIVNYTRNTEISDSTWEGVIKVNGADSGIRHSFQLEIDQFAPGEDKRFVNYKNYYFVAVAYAYNNFADFDPKRADSTQEQPYLESSKSAGGAPIDVVSATPNPANGDMGTVLNAAFGDGVKITRIEGRGNGGNGLVLSDSSEDQAVYGVQDVNDGSRIIHQSIMPTYKAGSGPVAVKVIDPLKLQGYDWELYIEGVKNTNDTARGLIPDSTTWRLVNISTGEQIYSERNLSIPNEQIIEKYGFSVNMQQVLPPSQNQDVGNGLISSDIVFSDPSNPWLAGVNDGENQSYNNWIRSGKASDDNQDTICKWSDFNREDTVDQVYEKLLDRYATTLGTWAPYGLAANEGKSECGFGVAFPEFPNSVGIDNIPSVEIVITPDKSKWSRSLVFEMQDDSSLTRGIQKFDIRSHASWNLGVDEAGRPIYATDPNDTGFSWFPGYAINVETGERLNIYFGEDSWLKAHNGSDMLWNPTSTVYETPGNTNLNVIFGGKHYIYVQNVRYDSCQTYIDAINSPSVNIILNRFNKFAYVGVPILNPLVNSQFTSIEEGMIPSEVRIRIQIARPYNVYETNINGYNLQNGGEPLYSFTTKGLAPTSRDENANIDKQQLLDRIHAVPNPYYGYAGYELNRYDTRVKIINLPTKATVNIYSLDGSLIRRLEKDDANTSFIDWDIRNSKSLPIASGMYLIHVNAEGIGEKVIRWFGAMRPIDVTNY